MADKVSLPAFANCAQPMHSWPMPCSGYHRARCSIEHNQDHLQEQACVAGHQMRSSSRIGTPTGDLVHTAAHWQAGSGAAAAAAAAAGLGPRYRRERSASRSDCSASLCRSCALLTSSPALPHIQGSLRGAHVYLRRGCTGGRPRCSSSSSSHSATAHGHQLARQEPGRWTRVPGSSARSD